MLACVNWYGASQRRGAKDTARFCVWAPTMREEGRSLDGTLLGAELKGQQSPFLEEHGSQKNTNAYLWGAISTNPPFLKWLASETSGLATKQM